MLDHKVKGLIVVGQNPAVGSANSGLHRKALAELEWLVVRDLVEIETAAFWYDSPEVERGELRTEDIGTEVFFLPAAAHTEKDGSFTNTQRLLQWHHKAVEPPGDCRSELWFYYHLGRIIREKLAGSEDERDRPLLELQWDYPTEGEIARAERRGGAARDQRHRPRRAALSAYTELKADGSTRVRLLDLLRLLRRRGEPGRPGASPAPSRRWVAPEWGWAWPANRRILYNRASADPDGRPWSERKRYVWWDEARGQVDGRGRARLPAGQAAGLRPARRRQGRRTRSRGDAPVHHAGRTAAAGCSCRPGWSTARCRRTTSRTSRRVANPLYGQQSNPARQMFDRPGNRSQPVRRRARRRPLPVRDDDVPADRAPHRGRDEPVRALPRRAAAGDVLRGQPRARRRARSRARRLGDGLHASGRRSRRRVLVTERMAPAAGAGAAGAPGRPAVSLGLARPHAGRVGERPVPDRRSIPTCTSRRSRRRRATSARAARREGRVA